MSLQSYRQAIHSQHGWTNRALENRCRPTLSLSEFTKTPLRLVLPAWRDNRIGWAKRKHHRAQAKDSRCIPTNPTAIIRYVFPDYVEDQAIRVAAAESTGDCYGGDGYSLYAGAKNPGSTASGLFQLLDTWWRNPDGSIKFNPFDALANTRYALKLWYDGGQSFYRHWAASAGCWG